MEGLGLSGLGLIFLGASLGNRPVIVAGLLLLALGFVSNIRARGRKVIFWIGALIAAAGQLLPPPWGLPTVVVGSIVAIGIAVRR